MAGRTVKVIVMFLDVFAVVAFVAGQAEQTLFKNWVFAVPHPDGEAETLLRITVTTDAVFGPAVGALARGFMIDELPRFAVRTLILSNGTPLSLAEVRPPNSPVFAVG